MAESWHVESQRKTTVLTGSGVFKPVWDIRFVTASGVHGSVEVDERNYNADYVRGVIDELVAHIDAVQNL